MKVSRTRCLQSMEFNSPDWTVEGRLRTSDLHPGWFWGTCILCGGRHFDFPYRPRSTTLSCWLDPESMSYLKSQTKNLGISRSEFLREVIRLHMLNTALEVKVINNGN